jgi:hypothetical protein
VSKTQENDMTIQRSEYLGVYNNTNENSSAEVPFRVAIKRQFKGQSSWTNLGYCKSEKVAARIYNMYAINFFGKGAILNDIELSHDELVEFNEFVNNPEKPKRATQLAKARDRAHAVLNGGHTFRKHTELERKNTLPANTQEPIPGLV